MVLSNLKSRQQEEEEQLTENEKQRRDQLEKEERKRLQANNGHAQMDNAEIENVSKTHAQSDTYKQERQQTDTSSVVAADLQQQSNTNTEKLAPEQEAEIVVAEVKQGLRGLFVKNEEFIIRLGNALKKVVKRERDICEEIKIALKDEISEGIISTRTIELHCRPEWRREWKRRTKPESEKNSLSRQESMAVAKTQDGKSVTVTEKEVGNGSDTSQPQPEQGVETDININSDTTASKSSPAAAAQQEETSQPGTGIDQQPICESCPTKDAKIMELEVALKNLKAINSAVNDEVASPNKHNKDLTDTNKEVFVSHIPMHFEHLRKDMETVSEIIKGAGRRKCDVFWKIWVDLRTHVIKIEFCGITQQKDAAMISTGKGVLKETL